MEPTTTNTSYETTPQTQPTVWAVGAKGGLYTGLVLIIFSLIGFVAGMNTDMWYGNLTQLFSFIVGVYLTQKAFKDQGNGFMSYGQGIGLGAVLGLVSGVMVGVFSVIYLTMIDPTILTTQLEEVRYQMEEQGMSDDQIDQFISVQEMMMGPVGIFFSVILMYVLYSFIISLIVSAFTKNTDPTLEY